VSTDPADVASAASRRANVGQDAGAGDAQGQPSEEELRAAYQAEMSRVTSADMVLQAAVSLLNIGGYRLGLAPGQEQQQGGSVRDLEQVRDAIDGVRALLGILERSRPSELRPLRDALSQLQMAYAREAGRNAPTDRTGAQGAQAAPVVRPDAPAPPEKPDGPGPAESSGRLWVPGR
jgi:hypothetical protein